MKFITFFKAARADFLPASAVPFLTGAAFAYGEGFQISPQKLVLGMAAVACMHLSANLVNDYYDTESGADGRSAKTSSLFGGSRAIQAGVYTGGQVLAAAGMLLSAAFLFGAALFYITRDPVLMLIMLAAAFLAVEYTAPPLKLSYNMAGEAVIFILFGVLLVAGSFYLFSGTLTRGAVFLSLPVSFLILSVILCNEIPDYSTDAASGKRNLHSLLGPGKGYLLYGAALGLSFASIILNVKLRILPWYSVFAAVLYFPGVMAIINLKKGEAGILPYIEASRLSVLQHSIAGAAVAVLVLL